MLKLSPDQFRQVAQDYLGRQSDGLASEIARMVPPDQMSRVQAFAQALPEVRAAAQSLGGRQMRHLGLHALLSYAGGPAFLQQPEFDWLNRCMTLCGDHPPHYGELDDLFPEVVAATAEKFADPADVLGRSGIDPGGAEAFLLRLPPLVGSMEPTLPCGADAVPNDEMFRVYSERTGKPLVGAAYRIETPTGTHEGVTDDEGRTERVHTGLRVEPIRLVLIDRAPGLDPEDAEPRGC